MEFNDKPQLEGGDDAGNPEEEDEDQDEDEEKPYEVDHFFIDFRIVYLQARL